MKPNASIVPAKPRFTLVKVAALVCSIVLVGAYVAYRGGGGGGALMPSTKSGRVVSPVSEVDEPRERVMMPGSKSGPVTPPTPTTPTPTTATTARSERMLMSGSKSMVLTEPAKPVAQQPTTQSSGK